MGGGLAFNRRKDVPTLDNREPRSRLFFAGRRYHELPGRETTLEYGSDKQPHHP